MSTENSIRSFSKVSSSSMSKENSIRSFSDNESCISKGVTPSGSFPGTPGLTPGNLVKKQGAVHGVNRGIKNSLPN